MIQCDKHSQQTTSKCPMMLIQAFHLKWDSGSKFKTFPCIGERGERGRDRSGDKRGKGEIREIREGKGREGEMNWRREMDGDDRVRRMCLPF